MTSIETILAKIPTGTSKVTYQNSAYNITKTIFNSGKSIKIYAEELGGTNFISCNFYETTSAFIIKPCEMPKAKVIDFLNQFKLND